MLASVYCFLILPLSSVKDTAKKQGRWKLTLTLQKLWLLDGLRRFSKPRCNVTAPPGPLDWLTY